MAFTFYEFVQLMEADTPRSILKGSGPYTNPNDAAIAGDRVQEEGGFHDLVVFLLKVSQQLQALHERGMQDPVGKDYVRSQPDESGTVSYRQSIGYSIDALVNEIDWLNRTLQQERNHPSSGSDLSDKGFHWHVKHRIQNIYSALGRVKKRCELFTKEFGKDAKREPGDYGHYNNISAVQSSPYYRTVRGILNYLKQGRIIETLTAYMDQFGIEPRKSY